MTDRNMAPGMPWMGACLAGGAWLVTSLMVGCQSQDKPHPIHEVEIKPPSSSSQMPMDAVHGFAGGQVGAMGGMPMMPSSSDGGSSGVEFETPEGWVPQAGSGMRAATFKIKDGSAEKEATIVILPSTNEGYTANIRRWLGQLNLSLSDQQVESFIAARETFSTVDNVSGALFDFTQIKGAQDNGKGFMLASIIETDGRIIFVKLMGAADFLRQNKSKFLALSKSVRLGNTEEDAGSASMADGGSMGGSMGGGMNMGMQSNDPQFNQKADGVTHLTWITPSGWKSLNASGMRTGSFSVTHEGKTADGSIIQLPGSAGGLESNVRRWMEQAGMTQLNDNDMKSFLASQRRIKTKDGYDGTLINLAAQLNGNLLQENSILAVIVNAPNETIFVKLTGPRSVLLQNVEALAQLSSSLTTAK